MKSNITEDKKWELIGYVKISSIRYTLLKMLKDKYLIPQEITKETDYSFSRISITLKDLKKNKLVECMNEKSRKGRLYHTSKLGLEILEMMEENKL